VNYVKQLKKTTIDAEGNFFYNDVHNLIRLASVDANQFTYINVANSRTLGGAIETSIIYEQFRAKAGMQVTGIYSDFGKGVKTNGFETTPAISLDMSYRWSKVKMEFSLFYKYVGKQPGVYVANTTDLKTFYTRSYHLLDLTCAKYLFKNLIKLSIGGKNLLNVKNIQATGNYVSNGVHGSATNTLPVGWGTSFFADLKINLNGSNFRKKSMTTEDEK
jgi:outer membrane receptor for ferrienterochelin and colicins